MPDAAPQSAATAGHPIQAPIVFMTHDQAEKPRVMMNADHAVPNERLGTFREATVPILDARALPEPASLDVQGFALSTMPTAMADFYDEAMIEAVYYPGIIDFLKRETGATAASCSAASAATTSSSAALLFCALEAPLERLSSFL